MASQQHDRDRRLEPRVHDEEALEVEYVVPSPHVHDLSASGVYLSDSRTLQLGQPVMLRLRLSGSEPITVSGMVRRVDPGKGMAIEFIQIDSADRRRLKEFVVQSNPQNISPAGEDVFS